MDDRAQHALLRRVVTGDIDALQQLIVACHGSLHGTIEGRMDGTLRRHVDPDDVLQQAYAAAFQSIQQCSFDSPAGFYKWLERIALDRLTDLQRHYHRKKRDIGRRRSSPEGPATSYPDLVERLVTADSTPSRQLIKREAAAIAISSLARLTEDQRTVVRMRILDGRQAADVATELGKSEAAIHMLCHRGLKALREVMDSMVGRLSGG